MGVILERKKRILLNEPHIVTTTPAGVANFSTDMLVPLKLCKVEFSPVQAGSGDPSPDNVRPISGWTGCNVYRAGKNLFDADTVYAAYKIGENSFEAMSNAIVSVHYYIPQELVGKQLTFSAYLDLVGLSTPTFFRCRAIVNGSNINGNLIYANNEGFTSVTFTPISTNDYIGFTWGSGKGVIKFKDFMLEIGSFRTPYEPYTGTTIPLDWTTEAGTVYGGYVDLVSGELVAEYGIKTLTGTEGINWKTTGVQGLYIDSGILPQKPNRTTSTITGICNMVNNLTGNNSAFIDNTKLVLPSKGSKGLQFSSCLSFWGLSELSSTALNSKLQEFNDAGNPLTFTYQLDTPLTYQLTPTQLKSLRGVNNIWSDANGDISVKYWTH